MPNIICFHNKIISNFALSNDNYTGMLTVWIFLLGYVGSTALRLWISFGPTPMITAKLCGVGNKNKKFDALELRNLWSKIHTVRFSLTHPLYILKSMDYSSGVTWNSCFFKIKYCFQRLWVIFYFFLNSIFYKGCKCILCSIFNLVAVNFATDVWFCQILMVPG